MGKVSEEQLLEAIKNSMGVISTIAKRLNVAWHTANDNIQKYESTIRALQDEVETSLDMAESELLKKVKKGDTTMIKYYLSTKGKKRGYTLRQEITGPDGDPVKLDLTKLSDKALDELMKAYEDQDASD